MNAPNKKATKAKNSTLAIDSLTSEKLNLFCQKQGINKKEFIEMALGYFERTGVDIRSNDVIDDLTDIREKVDSILKLQADSSVKLTGIQQSTLVLHQVQENTTKLVDTHTKKKWWQR